MSVSQDALSQAEEYRKQFAETGRVCIPNFLSEEQAEKFGSLLENYPQEWWTQSIMPNPQKVINLPLQETDKIKTHRRFAQESLSRGLFSYSFKRTFDNHYEGCYCEVCNVRKTFKSSKTLDFLNKVTQDRLDSPLTSPGEMFASCYDSEDFLSIHHDINKGKVATVLNMTREWRPDWGGNLFFLTKDHQKVTDVFSPKFNTLMMFHVPEDGVEHFVSHVIPTAKKSRLAFTGWLS